MTTYHYITANQGGLNTGTTDVTLESEGVVISGDIDMRYQSDDTTFNGGGSQTVVLSGGLLGSVDDYWGATSGNDAVTITETGYIDYYWFGAVDLGGGGNTVTNDGTITASNYAGAIIIDSNAGVGTDNSDPNTIENTGVISGSETVGRTGDGVVQVDGSSVQITNSGSILASDGAIGITLFPAVNGSSIFNSGLITGGISAGSGGSVALTNASAGTIDGAISISDGTDLSNSGLIDSAVTYTSSAAQTVINHGTIEGALSFGGASGSAFTNTSAIDGAVTDSSVNAVAANSGVIDGALSFSGADSGLTNDGTLEKGLTFSAGGAALTNAHGGSIDGAVSFTGSTDRFDNAGSIDGAISLLAGGDIFTNAGSIDGAVAFTGPGTGNKVTNSGAITGNVTIDGGNSTFTNSGAITGTVLLTTGGMATNTGTINGNFTLVGTSITVDNSRGKVTGAITASSSDTFDYQGLFGTQTIDNFIAGGGATHDTIQFAANDFGTFLAVQAATTQVGSDAVIKLDANDSITLVGVTAASLAAADFKFV